MSLLGFGDRSTTKLDEQSKIVLLLRGSTVGLEQLSLIGVTFVEVLFLLFLDSFRIDFKSKFKAWLSDDATSEEEFHLTEFLFEILDVEGKLFELWYHVIFYLIILQSLLLRLCDLFSNRVGLFD